MARWKIELNGKGLRRDTVDKIVKGLVERFGEGIGVRVTDNTPPESRADRLADALSLVDDARGEVEGLKDELQEWYDNLPENFQNGDKGEQLTSAIDELDTLANSLEEAAGAGVDFPSMFG